MTEHPVKQILVAGVGNAWLRDDAFGGEVARRLEADGMSEGVSVMDFGTGGLDLAYELIRGYDALVLLDASRQGFAPGTLYVLEPEREEFAGALQDGESIDPHDMNPRTMLRFVNALGGWPGGRLIQPQEVAAAVLYLCSSDAGAVTGTALTVAGGEI